MRKKPDDYVPPYPAYQAHPHAGLGELCVTLFGLQSTQDVAPASELAMVRRLAVSAGPAAPLHVEHGWHRDTQGHRNDVLLMYWREPDAMHSFWQLATVTDCLTGLLSGPIGWWRESFHAPTTSLDGNYSIPHARYGISRYSELREEQFHAYFGSMRDRVPDFAAGHADGNAAQLSRLDPGETRGRRLRIIAPPAKLCFIRGAFAWEEAGPEEQAVYRERMYPVYQEGSDWLTANPLESNCVSMRLIEEVREGYDNGVQVESLGWFLTLKDLERWTHHHPRHVAIMKTIMEYMARFDFKPRLNLGHEVIVVPGGQATFEYGNCHPATGFLPFFPAASV